VKYFIGYLVLSAVLLASAFGVKENSCKGWLILCALLSVSLGMYWTVCRKRY